MMAPAASDLKDSRVQLGHQNSETTCQERLVRPLLNQEASLSRHGTLLNSGATTLRRAAELKSLLGNANSRLHPGATISHYDNGQDPTSFEQAKHRARVEIDIALHSNVCVEGGVLKGFIKLRIRPRLKKESIISIGDAKLRIIGFESTESDYHEFFQHSAALSAVVTSSPKIYYPPSDAEGFCVAREGVHKLEFEMHLPMNGVSRPKGVFRGQSGIALRYIVLVSIKVKDEHNKRSIAHFYRDCEVYPRLNPSFVLAAAKGPIRSSISKSLFMGGTGEVRLTAGIHREYFVAGTQVPVSVNVQNGTKKTFKRLTLTLYRTTVVYKRNDCRDLDSASTEIDMAACQKSTTRRPVATSTLEMAQPFPRGHASTSGWWPGVPSGEHAEFSYLLLIPPDALTHTGRLIDVQYSIRVSLNCGSLATDVCVTLPIGIVNFLSLDPPPTFSALAPNPSAHSSATVLLSGSDDGHSAHTSESPGDTEEEGCELYTDNDQDEAQLGNLSMCEDMEDLVHHAIVSAQTNDHPELAYPSPRCNSPDQIFEGIVEESSETEPENQEPGTCCRAELYTCSGDHTCEPTRPLGPSSFALRVQQKLQAAATARKPLSPDNSGPELPGCEGVTLTSTSTNDEPTLKDDATPVDSCLDTHSQSAISCASGYRVASSSFLDDRYFGPALQFPCGVSTNVHAPIVGLPFPEQTPALSDVVDTHGQGDRISAAADRRTAEHNLSGVGMARFFEEARTKRPSISAQPSAGSVKDRI
ncbi:hypothetical protein GGX14DRAFT_489235, partial [Mycena pura]